MDYQRWSIKERSKWFFWENAGNFFLLFIAFLAAIQFPEHAISFLNEVASLLIQLISFIEAKKEFIFGVLVAVFLNYLKDKIKTSKETKDIGHALREEANHLGYSAKYHVEKFKKFYETLEDLESALICGKSSLIPDRLFIGTDYMPIFKANIAKVAALKVRFLWQGDEVIPIAIRMHEFIIEYDNHYTTYLQNVETAKKRYSETENENTRRDTVRDFYFHRDEYISRVEAFRSNCTSLTSVLAKFRH